MSSRPASRKAYFAAYYLAHRDQRLVQNAEWYRVNRDAHRARAAMRYAARRVDNLAGQRRYRRTAAGMLAKVRSSAKVRKL